ncbi:trichothecene C-8 hydroxylase [Colletotrichum falcatum]|nr:trichothecene C-8 hydroxylase [Colletotrichum falcatum]
MILYDNWLRGHFYTPQASYIVTAFVIILLSRLLSRLLRRSLEADIPLINPKRRWEITKAGARGRFLKNARTMMHKAMVDYPGRPFRVYCGFGEVIMLPAELINEIRNDNRFKFSLGPGPTLQYPGFEAANRCIDDTGLFDVIKNDLTRHLGNMTEAITDATGDAINRIFRDSTEWHDIPLKQDMLQLIGLVSSCQFVGEELRGTDEWLKVSLDYANNIFVAAFFLGLVPPVLRPVVHWFIPQCRALRVAMRKARKITRGILEKRRKENEELAARGEPQVVSNDIFGWSELRSGSQPHYDPAASLMALSILALHTTADLLCRTLLDLAERPELVEELRLEMTKALSDKGWKMDAVHEMRLLDSVIKESMRLDPGALTSLSRVLEEEVRLSDGTVLPKGSQTLIPSYRQWNPAFYENPDVYDPYRFLRMRREKDKEKSALLVSTTENFTSFGHGVLACPGRFFAAVEIKIALIHLLLGYDFRPASGYKRRNVCFDFVEQFDPDSKICMRMRREFVDLHRFARSQD